MSILTLALGIMSRVPVLSWVWVHTKAFTSTMSLPLAMGSAILNIRKREPSICPMRAFLENLILDVPVLKVNLARKMATKMAESSRGFGYLVPYPTRWPRWSPG